MANILREPPTRDADFSNIGLDRKSWIAQPWRMDMPDILLRAGGVTKLGAAIGRHHATILGWRRVPAEHVPAVSKHTGISRHDLRPDLYEGPDEQVAA